MSDNFEVGQFVYLKGGGYGESMGARALVLSEPNAIGRQGFRFTSSGRELHLDSIAVTTLDKWNSVKHLAAVITGVPNLPAFTVGERVMVKGIVGSYGGRFGEVKSSTDDGAIEWYVQLDGDGHDLPFTEDELTKAPKSIDYAEFDIEAAGGSDPVEHPAHYGGDTPYEAIKVIEAWGLGFNLGNTVKYINRAGKKGLTLEDLKKASFYLNREIELEEAK